MNKVNTCPKPSVNSSETVIGGSVCLTKISCSNLIVFPSSRNRTGNFLRTQEDAMLEVIFSVQPEEQ